MTFVKLKRLVGTVMLRLLPTHRPQLAPGEPPIKVFLSSVMSADMTEARRQTVETLQALPWAQPWAFEFTPGSSENVVKGYIRHVREADFVIWLVGQTTTRPVQTEIQEALRTNRRLIVVKLPSEARDKTTNELLAEVGSRAKWVDPTMAGSLRKALEMTLVDEVIRALRGVPGLATTAALETAKLALKVRCISRWEAAGLTYDEACDFFLDRALGDPACLGSPIDRKVLALKGDVGAGKSLIADRFLQQAIERFAADPTAAVPMFVRADSIVGNLAEYVLSHASDLGDPRIQGAFVVADGADEAGISRARQLLTEARVLTESWPNTRMVITSRHIPDFGVECETAIVPMLSEDQAYALVARVAGREVTPGMAYGWPSSVRASIRFPLFAIILGSYLRNRWSSAKHQPQSMADLLQSLVSRALQKSSDADAVRRPMRKLAALSIDRGGGAVPLSELGGLADSERLVGTGLVVQEGWGLRFPLPILTQWFAAEELVETVDVAALVRDQIRLEKWRYPFVIAIGTLPHDKVSGVISQVARAHPGFVSQIVDGGLAQWGLSEEFQAPPPLESGKRLTEAMAALAEGIGVLAPLIGPIRPDGRLRPVGVARNGASLVVCWYEGAENLDPVVSLPKEALSPNAGLIGWRRWQFTRPGHHSAWAWRWTLEDLRSCLDRLIKDRSLPIDEGFLRREELWGMALGLLDRGSLDHRPVPFDELCRALSRFPPHVERAVVGGRIYSLGLMRWELARLKAEGLTEMLPPWPGPDQDFGDGWVWSGFSDEQILARSRVVFGGALEGYTQLMSKWFSGFTSRLQRAALMPARLVGVVHPPRRTEGFLGGPGVTYYFEPLPTGAASEIDFRLGDAERGSDLLGRLAEQIRVMRPEVSDWLFASLTCSVLDIFEEDNATKLAYKWLEEDLRRIAWIT